MRVGEGVWQDRTSGGRGVAGYSEYVMKGDKQFTKMQGGGRPGEATDCNPFGCVWMRVLWLMVKTSTYSGLLCTSCAPPPPKPTLFAVPTSMAMALASCSITSSSK